MIRYRVLAQAVSLFAGSMACAQIDAEAWQTNATFATNPAGAPYIRVPLGLIPATLYADGSRVQTENEQVWRYVCGSHGETTTDALARDVQIAKTSLAESAGVPTTTRGSGGLDIVFNPNGSVPAAAVAALADVEAYIESQFDNETTMTIDVSFASMNPNVIGVTGNIFVQTPWMDARPALRASMDFDDEIQDFLPTGAVPVRYSPNGSVSNELRVFFSRGNYRAVVGSISGSVAQITLNSQYNFDYNPANGVPGSATSFIDVMVHEVGHMLGFVSGVDDRVNDIDVLDLFRFRRGSDPNNPSTLAEFTTTPRLAVFDAPGTDQSNSDIITDEYRMSDGNPYQASHFREVSIGSPIGIMDPALAGGETFYPNYYQTADLKMFDAIGYIYPPCDHPSINSTPPAVTSACAGETVMLTVGATGSGSLDYQWRRGVTDIVNDPGHISGATTATLTLTLEPNDAATNYNCVVTTSVGCFSVTDEVEVRAGATPSLLSQPNDGFACMGQLVQLSVNTPNSFDTFVEWRRGETVLPPDPNHYSTTSGPNVRTLTIFDLRPADIGNDYNVRLVDINSSCEVITDFFSVSAGEPTITDEPDSIAVPAGGTAQFDIVADGASVYQWRRNGMPLSNGGDIGGAMSTTLVIMNVELADAGDFDCVTTSAGGCQTISAAATLTVDDAAPCYADVTGDGQRDLSDLAGMVASFGLAAGDPGFSADADLDNSGVVDLSDLAGLLAVFGVPCP